jgi:hypothetical protein
VAGDRELSGWTSGLAGGRLPALAGVSYHEIGDRQGAPGHCREATQRLISRAEPPDRHSSAC